MENSVRTAIASVGMVLILATALPASAATGTGSFTATCDPTNYPFATNGVFYQHSAKGTLSITQKATNPVLTSSVKAVSQNGNALSVKTVSDGGVASWANVLPGQYQVQARSSSTVNCNGSAFGNGNYTFNYSITY